MNSRERLIAAIHHRQPDRCPIDLGSNGQTGMNVSTLYRLRKALGLPEHPIRVVEPFQMLGEIEEDLMNLIQGDVIGLWNTGNMFGFGNQGQKPWQLGDGTPLWVPERFDVTVDDRGYSWMYPQGDKTVPPSACMPPDGYFFDGVERAPAFDFNTDEEDLTPVEDFRKDFAVATDESARYWEEESKRLFEGTPYGIMGVLGGAGLGDVALVGAPHLKEISGIRRLDDWLAAHAIYPDYIDEIFGYQTEVMLKNLEIYKQAVGERIQVVWISGTDFGTQNSTFLSVDTFRSLYKPHYQKINDWVHQNTGWKTFYHTCGCITNLLEDLAEMGVDCLNPVQVNAIAAGGLDAKQLKARYGDKFTFWGGGVDTQTVLPYGTPEEVGRQVRERVETFSPGGGYVFSSIHNVVAKVPPENLIAMYEAVLGKKLR